LATLSLGMSTGHATRQLDVQLRLKFSGGEALKTDYCRQCAIGFSLELLPSAQITSWDVLPAEM
jgi:trafficking protein particle complex subunit 9